MNDCNLVANCDGTGEFGCFVDCCNINCPPENPCQEIKIKYYCQPIGACCYPTNQDCSRTTQCQCEANGGQYQGDGSKCEPDNPCAKCVPPCDPYLCLECVPVECTPDPSLATDCSNGLICPGGQAGNWISDPTIEIGCGKCVCPCATCTHVCQNGQCINVGPGNGNYNTVEDCQADCGQPFFGGISTQAILRYECRSYCDSTINEICCFGNCCAENSVCCNDGTCCAQGQTCCLDEGAGTYTCCNPGESCCGGICCPAGNNCCTESNTSPPYCSPNPCPIPGCMNPYSPNYNPAATCDNGSCRTCCNAGLCVVLDRDAGGNCNNVGNGCCDDFCFTTANDCSPTYLSGSGPLVSCDRDLDGNPLQNEYTSCFSNDCVQGYLNQDVLAELEKNIENYNKSQFSIYNQYENEVFNQNNSPKYYQEIKEYNFSALESCACTCPQPFRYQGFILNYENNLQAMNAACSEYTITITTDYECGLTGGTTVSLAPCCCDGNLDTNTYTVSASSSGDCLEFQWDDTNIKVGQSRTITIVTGEDCECVYCGTECVPFSTPFIKKLEGNKIKLSLDKKQIQKRLNSIRKKIIKKRKN